MTDFERRMAWMEELADFASPSVPTSFQLKQIFQFSPVYNRPKNMIQYQQKARIAFSQKERTIG